MDDIKKQLKVKAAEKGIRISDDDMTMQLIDIISLWIQENNNALIAGLTRKAEGTDAVIRREHIKQFKHMTDLVAKVPLDVSSDTKKVIREQVRTAMEEEIKKLQPPPWWQQPSVLIGCFNAAIGLGILISLLMLVK